MVVERHDCALFDEEQNEAVISLLLVNRHSVERVLEVVWVMGALHTQLFWRKSQHLLYHVLTVQVAHCVVQEVSLVGALLCLFAQVLNALN